ncbi:hypothetical protein CRI84_03760 [Liquorilactobacillus hordei]|nr:hypothetical protein [Liquorilactobacillus hordei]
MNITSIFFVAAVVITLIFLCLTIVLFISYLIILERVNKNFKVVNKND